MNAPTWDLTSYFPSFRGEAHTAFSASVDQDARALLDRAKALPDLNTASVEAWTQWIQTWEELSGRLGHLGSFVGCLNAAHAEEESYQVEEGRLAIIRSTVEKATSELKRALAHSKDAEFAALIDRKEVAGGTFVLAQLRDEAQTRMSTELEALASDLAPDGLLGWGRLYDQVSGGLSFEMEYPDGKKERTPMAKRRSLMSDADRQVRAAAFRTGNAAWESVGPIVASSLNHLAGTRHVLNERRGIKHIHDVALRDAAISKKTLSAMMEAVLANRTLIQTALKNKGKIVTGKPSVAFYDLEAPVFSAKEEKRLDWSEGLGLIRNSFGKHYPGLLGFFEHALEKKWIEAEARDKKRPGAFCTGSDMTGEPRVYMTYQGSYGDVSTLAHEVGHAFHHHVLKNDRVLARQYPMTLAETASTFAENLLVDGLLSDAKTTPNERNQLLGEIVGDASAFLLDIPVRFEFETAFYEARKKGELPVSELSALMKSKQREIFGSALEEGGEDPWFWASKLHFYIPEVAFYNFPYTFGYLLSRALFAEFKRVGPDFLPRYEAFLRATGQGYAQDVAKKTLGKDLEAPEFWNEAIQTLAAPIAEFEKAVAATL